MALPAGCCRVLHLHPVRSVLLATCGLACRVLQAAAPASCRKRSAGHLWYCLQGATAVAVASALPGGRQCSSADQCAVCRGIVQESGLAGLVSGSVGSKPGGSIPAASAAHGPAAGATSAAKVLQQQNDQLQAKLEEALDAANSWKSLHGKLHQFCVQQLLSTGQFGAAT